MLIENVGPATRMVTIRDANAVYFGVEHLEEKEWVTVWSRTVPFRQDAAHRAGGPAFKDAAHQQESVCAHHAEKSGTGVGSA